MKTFVSVSNETSLILVTRVLGNNLWNKRFFFFFLLVDAKIATRRKKRKGKESTQAQ